MNTRLLITPEDLRNQKVTWTTALEQAQAHAHDAKATEAALDRAEKLWGVNELTQKFRQLLAARGVSIYDRTIEHHFTGSAIVIDPAAQKILMTFHPTYQGWQQLGGHDEGEHDPVAVSAREAWEESGIEDLWICDWPVRVDPHAAFKCKTVPGKHHNLHYDICYMAVAGHAHHRMSEESAAMEWFAIAELRQLVQKGQAQQRAFEMAENALALLDSLARIGNVPSGVQYSHS